MRKGFEYVDYVIVALSWSAIVYAGRAPPAGRAGRRPMRRAEAALPLRHAVALGLLQGPDRAAADLLLGAHDAAAVARGLAVRASSTASCASPSRWRCTRGAGAGAGDRHARASCGAAAGELDGAARDRARALARAPRARRADAARRDRAAASAGPRSIAAGLIVGAGAMALADARRARRTRAASEARRGATASRSALAQALALVPGVSRSGATLTAARARGFARADAQALSWSVALPVIARGERCWRALRLARGARPRAAEALGGARRRRGLLSTLAAARALRRGGYGDRALLPFSLYRCVLAAVVIAPPAARACGR